jgi:ParB/RepB/Spo0J family partition protein
VIVAPVLSDRSEALCGPVRQSRPRDRHEEPATAERIVMIRIDRLEPCPWGSEVSVEMSSGDYETLKLAIAVDGIQTPLVVWACGKRLIVVAGMNRLKVAQEQGLTTVPAIVREFTDEHAAKLHALMDNLARRQLSTAQRAYLAYQFQRLITVGSGARTDLQPSSNLTKVDARRTAAELAGVSEGAVSAIKAVVESGNTDLLQSVLQGKTPLAVAANYAKSEGKPLPPPGLDGKPPKPGANGKLPGGPVVTVVQGDSSDLIANAARFYVAEGAVVCDVTFGCGVFWKKVDLSRYKFHASDIAMEPSVDLRRLPYEGDFADHLVLDPPHVHDT